MIVDTSAVIAIVGDEAEAPEFAELLASQPSRMSVATWFEGAMVAAGRGPRFLDEFDDVIGRAQIELVPLTAEHARSARAAFMRYGRGSGSPARLNFGDCFSYALSAVSGEALLFKGDDFARTDVRNARAGH